MTNEETINAIKHNKPTSGYTTLCEALDIAVSAIEKQIPKKAINDGTQFAICPECGASVNKDIEQVYNGETSYCVCCGQALDWSDNE